MSDPWKFWPAVVCIPLVLVSLLAFAQFVKPMFRSRDVKGILLVAFFSLLYAYLGYAAILQAIETW